MTLKFYLHDATTTDTGTLPASGATVSGDTPGAGVTIALTNKTMNGTIGTAQASIAKTTLANTADQAVPIGRWLSDPIAAQTIAGAQTLTIHCGGSQSNTSSSFTITLNVQLWRPSTGAVVGAIFDSNHATGALLPSPTGTVEADESQTVSSTAQTAQDGDVLVLELWRSHIAQGMATAYTNTIYYDGTTEGSATSNAAYLLFTNDVAMSTGGAAVAGYVHRRGPSYRR